MKGCLVLAGLGVLAGNAQALGAPEDFNRTERTLISPKDELAVLACQDHVGGDDLRPVQLGCGMNIIQLSDGTVAVRGCWSEKFLEAWRERKAGAQEKVFQQVQSLRYDVGRKTKYKASKG